MKNRFAKLFGLSVLGLTSLGFANESLAASCSGPAIPNYQSGISYSIQNSDKCKWLIFQSANSIAVTLPVPSQGISSDFSTTLVANGTGTITVSSGSSATINGSASSITVPADSAATINVVDGNWIVVASGGAGSYSTITLGNVTLPDAGANVNQYNVVDVTETQFGAKCDWNGTTGTDDTTAINAALTYAKALPAAGSLARPFQLVSPKNHSCLITGPLNFTGIVLPGNSVSMGTIYCKTAAVCIDALGSRFIKFDELTLYGDITNPPAIGLQTGRISATSADFFNFNQVRIVGYYTFAGHYNFASEQVNYNGLYVYNRYASAGAYGVVLDGYNHWNAQSSFQTQTLPTNTRQSMEGDTFNGGQLQNQVGPALWAGGTRAVKLDNTYVASVAPVGTKEVIDLYARDAAGNENATFNIHTETDSANDVFLLTGTYATPILSGFTYSDNQTEPVNSVFKLDSGVTSASMPGGNIKVTSFFNNFSATPKLFDDASKWTVAGNVYLPSTANWVTPASFSGRFCLPTTCVNSVPTPAINRNPDFTLDQPNAGAILTPTTNQIVIDGWRTRFSGAVGSTMAFQQLSSSPPAGYSNFLQSSVSSSLSPTAAQYYIIRSAVEGPDVAALSLGNGGAQPFTLSFQAQANNTGVYTVAFTDSGRGRSYVAEFTISAINTWQTFAITVPGDTTAGTWTSQRNRPGLYIVFPMIVGSNFSTTAGAWQAGEFYTTSNAFAYSGTNANKLAIGAVHLYAGAYPMPYLPRTTAQELIIAQHWYRKSFQISTKPAQNSTALGATTLRLPFAQAVFGTAGQMERFTEPMYNNTDNTPPTMTFYSTTAASANCYNATQARDSGAAAAVNTADDGFYLACTLAVGDVIGDQVQAQWVADSGF